MIDIAKKYKTREGLPVEIISVSGRGDFPILGYVAKGHTVNYWTATGRWHSTPGAENRKDLIEVPREPITYTWQGTVDEMGCLDIEGDKLANMRRVFQLSYGWSNKKVKLVVTEIIE
jgi:hypothetical protein